MNMRKSKKGFTIVELVIVIAVIAILAAVLIPTFANLIRQANKSSDTQLVKNMNTILSAAEALNGKNETMADALQDILDADSHNGKVPHCLEPENRPYDFPG